MYQKWIGKLFKRKTVTLNMSSLCDPLPMVAGFSIPRPIQTLVFQNMLYYIFYYF